MVPLYSHFLEIRLRFFYILLSLLLTSVTSYYYQLEILYIIGRPFLELDHKFILIDLTEAFYTVLRMSAIISFFFVIPFCMYHFWSFYIPSRYNFERKILTLFSLVFFGFLVIEIMILYMIIFPRICEFLLSFEIISSPHKLPLNSQWNTLSLEFDKIDYDWVNPLYDWVTQLNDSSFLMEDPKNQNITNSFFLQKDCFSANNFLQDKNLLDRSQNMNGSSIVLSLEKTMDKQQEIREYPLSENREFPPFVNGVIPPLINGATAPVVLELTARLESYIKLTTHFYFSMLILFQLPFFILIFYYYNLIDCYSLCRSRKLFLFSSVLLSAFISPPDILSQSILAILFFFFYELLVFVGVFYSILLQMQSKNNVYAL